MKTAKVKDVKAGKPFEGQRGTLYGWWVSMDNGDNISVNTQSADRQPWNVGDEATYEIVKTHQGKNGPWHSAKKVTSNGFAGRSGGPGITGTAPRPSSGWSPEKEKSIMVQGLLKSIIESGADKKSWAELLDHAMSIHDSRVGAAPAAPAPTPAPAPASVVADDESDLPF